MLNKLFDLFVDSGAKTLTRKLKLQGGGNKLLNVTDRGFTEGVEFQSKDLHWFLNRWLDFHEVHFKGLAPRPTTSDSPAAAIQVQWARPEMVVEFWQCFLESHELPSDNRVIRALSNKSRTVKENDRHPATVPSSGSGHPDTWRPSAGLWDALPSMQDMVNPDAPPRKKQRVATYDPSHDLDTLGHSW